MNECKLCKLKEKTMEIPYRTLAEQKANAGCNDLMMDIAISGDVNNGFDLITTLDYGDEPVMECRTQIKYCPMCGRRLEKWQ